MNAIAITILVLSCVFAGFAVTVAENFSFIISDGKAVCAPYILLHPGAWEETSADERIQIASKRQSARFPSYVP